MEMNKFEIGNIDLVIMNLYPFADTVASHREDFEMCIENIDIGGPSMMRSSAKNHKYVAVLSSPSQYAGFRSELEQLGGSTSQQLRRRLALEAFSLSAQYDGSIAAYFQQQQLDVQTTTAATAATRCYEQVLPLKYGCNPHQKPAAICALRGPLGAAQLPFQVLNGTPGYINLLDAVNAWQLVLELKQALGLPAAASFKHCSPAGAAVGVPLSEAEAAAYEVADPGALSSTALAYLRARNADPMCSFGDFAAVSHEVDLSTALLFKAEVSDGLIAPGYSPEALEVLRAKKKGQFIVLQADETFVPPEEEFRELFGVVFRQRRNATLFSPAQHLTRVVVGQPLPPAALRDLTLASIAAKYTQSNSVAYAKGGQLVGVGAGQQSRVDCVKLAARKVAVWFLRQHPKVRGLRFRAAVKRQDRVNARVRYIEGDITAAERPGWESHFETLPEPLSEEEKQQFLATLSGVSVSSDAFFPFRDSIDHLSRVGVSFVAQPGGSIADGEVMAACEEYGMSMAFTDLRLFHH